MAAVFPESMDKLNYDDPQSCIHTIEEYIRYMQERMEFSNSNMTRNVSKAGVSSVEVYLMLTALQQTVAALDSAVQSVSGDVSSIKGDISTIKSDISDLKERVTALENKPVPPDPAP